MSEETKRCPYCREEIIADAVKCKHCGSMLPTPPTAPYDTLDLKLTGTPGSAGRRLADRYSVIKELGRGGMGVVYLAHDDELDMDVAVKLLPIEMANDRRALEQLHSEAKLSMSLAHPNIMRLHNLDTSGQFKFLVMEYVDGPDLLDLLREKERLPLEEALPIIKAICEGLDYAHAKRMLHRDLKPANIMVNSKGEVKITDFGIARQMRESMSMISQKTISGTPAYMAPEHIMGEHLTVRSDVYSLGAVAYELLSGHPPFYQGDILAQIRFKDPPPIPGIPDSVNAAILTALSKDAENRPATAAEFHNSLTTTMVGPGVEKSTTPEVEKSVLKETLPLHAHKKKKRRRIIAAIIILLCAAVAIAYYVSQRSGATPERTEEPKVTSTEPEKPEPTPSVEPEPFPTDEKDAKILLTEVGVLYEKGDYKQAAEKAAEGVRKFSSTSHAEQFAKLRREAEEKQTEIFAATEEKFNKHYENAIHYLQNKDLRNALLSFKDAEKYDDTGKAKKEAIDLEKKISAYDENIKKGKKLLNEGEHNKALTAFKEAQKSWNTQEVQKLIVEAQPQEDNREKYLADAQEAFKNKRYEDAIALFEKALSVEDTKETRDELQLTKTLLNLLSKGLKLKFDTKYDKETGLPLEVLSSKTCQELVLVRAGKFTMGSNSGELDEKPTYNVYLDSYYIDKHEVTWSLYKKFCKATGRPLPAEPAWGVQDNHPVVNVSWHDAKAYCDWTGLSLPTEAQWEKAARGSWGSKYPWGDTQPKSDICNYNNNLGKTIAVGKYDAGLSPLGCHDMAGNVWEWCADWYDAEYYANSLGKNPTGPTTGKYRVLRGGGWSSGSAEIRCSVRCPAGPSGKMKTIGFRCARTID